MKLKHSKIKNTGIIFELLIRQLTSDTLENKDSQAINILKKYFTNTELAKEHKIYEVISSVKGLSESKANIVINSIVESQRKLNQGKLRKEKYALISEIKDHYDLDNFFKAKIDNYKVYASAYMLFESDNNKDNIDPAAVSDYKFTILEHITTNATQTKNVIREELSSVDKGERLLIYKFMVEKFNEKYKASLNPKQKDLLREYINNITTTNKLRDYINGEMQSIKTQIKESIGKIQDPVKKIKIKQIAEIISDIPQNKVVNEDHVINLFNYYQLIDEITEATK